MTSPISHVYCMKYGGVEARIEGMEDENFCVAKVGITETGEFSSVFDRFYHHVKDANDSLQWPKSDVPCMPASSAWQHQPTVPSMGTTFSAAGNNYVSVSTLDGLLGYLQGTGAPAHQGVAMRTACAEGDKRFGDLVFVLPAYQYDVKSEVKLILEPLLRVFVGAPVLCETFSSPAERLCRTLNPTRKQGLKMTTTELVVCPSAHAMDLRELWQSGALISANALVAHLHATQHCDPWATLAGRTCPVTLEWRAHGEPNGTLRTLKDIRVRTPLQRVPVEFGALDAASSMRLGSSRSAQGDW